MLELGSKVSSVKGDTDAPTNVRDSERDDLASWWQGSRSGRSICVKNEYNFRTWFEEAF